MTDPKVDAANDVKQHAAPLLVKNGKLLSRATIWSDIMRLGRFGAVGITSTIVYFVVTTLLGRPPIDFDPVVSNVLGVASSVSVSYFGHHRFTFGVLGQHQHYLPRFIFAMTSLFFLSCILMSIGRYVLAFNHTLVTGFIAVFIPAMSFLVNMLWTFSRKVETNSSNRDA